LSTVPKSPGCFCGREHVNGMKQTKKLRDAYEDVVRWVPIRPLCGGIPNQVDVLALCILF
jgi:hypothetical protein